MFLYENIYDLWGNNQDSESPISQSGVDRLKEYFKISEEMKIKEVQTRYPDGTDSIGYWAYNSSELIRIGMHQFFHSNGELKYIQRFNKNGKEHGLWKEFNKNSQLIMSITFENGQWIETILEISKWKPIKYINIYSKSLPIYTRTELQQ